MGAEVEGRSGDTAIGTIKDVIINPSSGRADFAILSLSSSSSSSGGTSDTSSSSTGAGTSRTSRQSSTTSSLGSTSSSGEGKQVAVPWSLLRPASSSSYSSTS